MVTGTGEEAIGNGVYKVQLTGWSGEVMLREELED